MINDSDKLDGKELGIFHRALFHQDLYVCAAPHDASKYIFAVLRFLL